MTRASKVLHALASIAALCTGIARADDSYRHITVHSAVLTTFWHTPVSMEADVLLPPGYNAHATMPYPVIYFIRGFDYVHRDGGSGRLARYQERWWRDALEAPNRKVVLVTLGGMFHGVDTVYADSANLGPWETALTTELIPALEREFDLGGAPCRRFVAGHSSGGWASLWLQVTRPEFFGGVWSVSPDPVDFHDFMDTDLTAAVPGNFYHDAHGDEYRIDGTTVRDFVNTGGWQYAQFQSFNAVFSPHGTDGWPIALFDRKTGAIDPTVAAYWETHFDIASLLSREWPVLGPQLRGKLHLIIGDRDQFDLYPPVMRLQRELTMLGNDVQVEVVVGSDHFVELRTGGALDAFIVNEAASISC